MRLPRTAAKQRLLLVILGLWLVFWLAAGCITAIQIRNLTQISDSLVESGEALDTAGSGLQAIGRLPVVGERPAQLGDEVRGAAGEVRTAADSSRTTIRWVSVLVGAALVIIPWVQALVLCAPLLALVRDRRAVAAALRAMDQHPNLEKLLAHRAVQHLGYHELRHVSQDPWGDLARGSYRQLANAELTRLGLAGATAQQATGRA